MKTILKRTLIVALTLAGMGIFAQQDRDLDNFRYTDKRGISVFETPKTTTTTFDGLKVRLGGSFALQFQGISHENSDLSGIELQAIGSNFNLATANLDIDVALYDGVNMHLRTFLSSRHHNETYVKGGYLQVDKLDFVKEGFMEDFMQYATIRVGHMENNYGDAHFRRSDNAQTVHNPFVGNLIMDSYTTEVGAELLLRKNGFLGMVGVTNGKLNQSVEKSAIGDEPAEDGKSGGASFLAKLGYDKQINEDLRVRFTGSMYNTGYVPNSYLYSADRAGSRYYGVMIAESATSDNFRSGRYNPNLKNSITAIMFNPFVKYKGLEFFGTIETASGKATAEVDDRTANQFAGELLYRFGKNENLYIGGRYNTVDSEEMTGEDITIKRSQLVAGWFMTKNILMKMEYVNQKYEGFATTSTLNDGKFNGVILEAAISF
ncbi:hypothetical protein [Polaribacter sargassicola]|uniref:hypothetical protein n=1 Tax=Polaribacter sargassicola TaxID=2836891 RepID=UPI001F1705FA|nr:hypothetical protein [Polaribacter sp. DS7-9]MCG1037113.1 hypothetical protein [Polaribacter sp. DS7-9]